jgi:hypothetical protein
MYYAGGSDGQAVPDVAHQAAGSTPGKAAPNRGSSPESREAARNSRQQFDFSGMVQGLKGPDRENQVSHMYVDSTRHPTVGIGANLGRVGSELPKFMPRLYDKDGNPATPDQIDAEKRRVLDFHDHFAETHPGEKRTEDKYGEVTQLHSVPQEAEAAAEAHVRSDYNYLSKKIPGFSGYPGDAKEALLDMAYTNGAPKLVRGYPKLIEAAKEGRWMDAGVQSGRNVPPARNAGTKSTLKRRGGPWARKNIEDIILSGESIR